MKYSFNPYDCEEIESREFKTGRKVTLGKSGGFYGIVCETDGSPTLEITRAYDFEQAKMLYGDFVEEEAEKEKDWVKNLDAEAFLDGTGL